MDDTFILNDVVEPGIEPIQAGGITLYQASALSRIFAWADGAGCTIERLEGVFLDRATGSGQLSLDYMCERGADSRAFMDKCLQLSNDIQSEAATLGMEGCFEVGVTQRERGS